MSFWDYDKHRAVLGEVKAMLSKCQHGKLSTALIKGRRRRGKASEWVDGVIYIIETSYIPVNLRTFNFGFSLFNCSPISFYRQL
jgi:hypothetical protein